MDWGPEAVEVDQLVFFSTPVGMPMASWKVTARQVGNRITVTARLAEDRKAEIFEGSWKAGIDLLPFRATDAFLRRLDRVVTDATWEETWDARRRILLSRHGTLKIEHHLSSSTAVDLDTVIRPETEYKHREVWTEEFEQALVSAETNSLLDAARPIPGPLGADQAYALAVLAQLSYHFCLDQEHALNWVRNSPGELLTDQYESSAGLLGTFLMHEGAIGTAYVSGLHAVARNVLPPDAVSNGDAIVVNFPEAIVVAFRGTESPFTLNTLDDWLTNLATELEDPFWLELREGQGQDALRPRAAGGFIRALRGFELTLPEVLRNYGAPGKPILLTGHSQGGALASLAAPWLVSLGFKVDGLATFGAPRPGNREMARLIEQSVPAGRGQRFRENADPVTLVPFSGVGAMGDAGLVDVRHLGRSIWEGKAWTHPFPQTVLWHDQPGLSETRASEAASGPSDVSGVTAVSAHGMQMYVDTVYAWSRRNGGRLERRPRFP
ncbi:MAG: lipase family protein [Fimbriimonadaceae bacterium]|nr:lipase family protein [Fimbriimonadaceae bacterium]